MKKKIKKFFIMKDMIKRRAIKKTPRLKLGVLNDYFNYSALVVGTS